MSVDLNGIERIKNLFQKAAEYCHPFTVCEYEDVVGDLSMALRGYKSQEGRTVRGEAWGLSVGMTAAETQELESLLSSMPNTEGFYLDEEDMDDYQVGEDYGWDQQEILDTGLLDEDTLEHLQGLREEREEAQDRAGQLASRAVQITSRYL